MLMRDNQLYLVHYSLIDKEVWHLHVDVHKSLVNLSLKFDPDNRTDHYQTPEALRVFVNVAAKRQIKNKQIYRKMKINNLGPLQGVG